MCKFRRLKATEIYARVDRCGARDGNGWAALLLYKDARVDQTILDETVGPENWEKSYEMIDGKLYCTVCIWDSTKNHWVRKQDVGTESNSEPEKGQASDAFKRACFCWGIGRELYSAPDIFINLRKDEWTEVSGKVRMTARVEYKVAEIAYTDDGNISALTITDKDGNVRYRMKQAATRPAAGQDPSNEPAFTDGLKELTDEMAANEAVVSWVCRWWDGKQSLAQFVRKKYNAHNKAITILGNKVEEKKRETEDGNRPS